MEDRTNKLIQAYNENGVEIGLFRILGNNCPTNHFQEVINDYFNHMDNDDEENANLVLFRWGLERVFIDYSVNV